VHMNDVLNSRIIAWTFGIVSIRSVLLSYECQNDALAASSLHFRLLGSHVVLSTVSCGIVLTGIS
jgi:uncharacterized membrane protein YozB (DUF420 family)